MDPLSKNAEDFLRRNPDLQKALELFQIADGQYQAALRALRSPETRVSNSTNEPLPPEDAN